MGMSVGSEDGDDVENSSINTTPLVDVMLVLLIIFLITIPVVTKTVPLTLPTISNEATITKPENIIIEIAGDGKTYWNSTLIRIDGLLPRVQQVAVKVPQPEIHPRRHQREIRVRRKSAGCVSTRRHPEGRFHHQPGSPRRCR